MGRRESGVGHQPTTSMQLERETFATAWDFPLPVLQSIGWHGLACQRLPEAHFRAFDDHPGGPKRADIALCLASQSTMESLVPTSEDCQRFGVSPVSFLSLVDYGGDHLAYLDVLFHIGAQQGDIWIPLVQAAAHVFLGDGLDGVEIGHVDSSRSDNRWDTCLSCGYAPLWACAEDTTAHLVDYLSGGDIHRASNIAVSYQALHDPTTDARGVKD